MRLHERYRDLSEQEAFAGRPEMVEGEHLHVGVASEPRGVAKHRGEHGPVGIRGFLQGQQRSDKGVIGEVRTHPGTVKAGAEQERGRMDGAARDDHLTCLDLLARGEDTDGAALLNLYPRDERAAPDGQVGPVSGGLQVGVVGRDAAPVGTRETEA